MRATKGILGSCLIDKDEQQIEYFVKGDEINTEVIRVVSITKTKSNINHFLMLETSLLRTIIEPN